MSDNTKKYYWLKLKENFFNQKEIKKLRRIAGGDTYTIIYLKLQLLSIKKDGVLTFEGTEKDLAEQLSFEIDEDADNIQITLSFLKSNNLIEELEPDNFLLPKVLECIGKESTSAERVRKHREKKKLEELENKDIKLLQCNTEVTKCNTEIEIEKEIDKDIYIIFDKWNDLKVGIVHKDIKLLQAEIKKAIKKYKINNILIAIERLDLAVKDKTYFYNQKWSLKNFLKQSNGIENWLDEGQYYNNYINNKKPNEIKPTKKEVNTNFEY